MAERPTVEHRERAATREVRRFRLSSIAGSPAITWESRDDACSVGSHASNDLVIDDETVSRFHAEIRITPDGAQVRDLSSLNGTLVDGVAVRDAFLRHGSLLALGRVSLRFELERATNQVAQVESLGRLTSQNPRMREIIALLDRAAHSDATVLIEGETGTGKGVAAEAIHGASRRADGPFVVADCGALSANLLESELFGHERGAFTGADTRRIGACEEADGGTLFLDEIGELPLELQPKLLRFIDDRTVRRIGSNTHRKVDVRIIAATNRDLRHAVNERAFRSDLYYRLAVAKVGLPPLRERREDIPGLIETFTHMLAAPPASAAALLAPEMITRLAAASWPGNIRELRAHVERFLVFGELDHAPAATTTGRMPFLEARTRALAAFERAYLGELVAEFGSRTVQAAAAAGLDRVYLYRLLRRHRLR